MPTKLAPVTPGEVLAELYMEPYRLSGNALARGLRVDAQRVNEIIRGRRAITPETALRLARFFNTSARFWLNLQTDYDLRVAQRDLEPAIAREVRRGDMVPA